MQRVYSPTKSTDGTIYYVGNTLVFKTQYPLNQNETVELNMLENENPQVIVIGADDLLWVATNQNNLYVMRNGNCIKSISNRETSFENIQHICAYKNHIYLSTKTGLVVLDYQLTKDSLLYDFHFITQLDGLPSNSVNQVYCSNDAIYVATENGIGKLSENYRSPTSLIIPRVQLVKIDDQVRPLKEYYAIEQGSHIIHMQIAGVDLTGHLKNIQYAVNDTSHWIDLEKNQISLLLHDGISKVYIRIRDINNRMGAVALACTFDVALPFYEKIWFWIVLTAISVLLFTWWYNQRNHERQKINFNNQLILEKQRNSITADLHDEMGSTLSSLQLNSMIANKYIDKDINKTKEILEKIECQTKSISEKLGDMIWSMKPGQDEFLSLSHRIKNYTNDILGSLEIDYSIRVDQPIDSLLTDIQMRKNVLLILKEAINNAAKYSQANQMSIEVKWQNNELRLLVIDNGIGFEWNEKGNGLKSMQNRAEELNGHFQIRGNAPQGTIVQVNIPLPNIRDSKT
jgi:signal transduction histidine kinase